MNELFLNSVVGKLCAKTAPAFVPQARKTSQKNGRYDQSRPALVVRLTQACIQAGQVAILIYIYIRFSTFSLPYLFGVTLSSRASLVTEGFEAEETIRNAGSLVRYTLLG